MSALSLGLYPVAQVGPAIGMNINNSTPKRNRSAQRNKTRNRKKGYSLHGVLEALAISTAKTPRILRTRRNRPHSLSAEVAFVHPANIDCPIPLLSLATYPGILFGGCASPNSNTFQVWYDVSVGRCGSHVPAEVLAVHPLVKLSLGILCALRN